ARSALSWIGSAAGGCQPVGEAVRITARAKINLALRIGPRRADGFHDLLTLFQLIELGDELHLRVGSSTRRSVEVTGADVGPPERSMAFRAAELYAAHTGWPTGFEISIEKRIPVGGGLGGGSADGAAVLRALNLLAPRPLALDDLLAIAAELGSDLPFLVSGELLA